MWVIGKLRSLCIPYMWTLYVAVAMLAALTATQLVVPYLTEALVNSVLGHHHWGEIWPIVVGVIGLAALGGLLNFGQAYSSSLFGQKCTYRLRERLYARLQYHGFEYYDREHTGNLMQRLTGDVEAWRMFLGQGIINGWNFVFNVGFGLIVMFSLDARLTLLTLIFMPFLGAAVMRFDQRVRPIYTGIRQVMSRLQTVVQENIVGVRVVKSFAREQYEIEKFRAENEAYGRENRRAGREQAAHIPLMQLLGNLSAAVLLWYGGDQVIHGRLSLGALVAFFGLLGYLTGPTQQLGFLVNLYAQSHAAEDRLVEILETPDVVVDRPGAVVLLPDGCRGHVAFENVTFRYPGARHSALAGVSLDASPGRVVALLGATGSGKSTIVNLIPRFYECEHGSVRFDGRDVRDWTVRSLRRQIGIVPGETFLFSASVFENITYGRRDATLEDVRRAAAASQADDFIMELPERYGTVVGERGLGLSGGQRQRIAIARALLYRPSVLILDDATSSVDLETEFEIQQALESAMEGRTTFIIAHRLSSLRRADEILVLEHGAIVDRGRHEELLARGGLYHELFDIQFRDRDMLRPRAQSQGGGRR